MHTNLQHKYSIVVFLAIFFITGCGSGISRNAIVKLNTHLHPHPIIRTVLFSSNIGLLKQFYIEKNLKFIEYNFSDQTHQIATNAGLVIVDRKFYPKKENLLNGFFIYGIHDNSKNYKVKDWTICEKKELVLGNFIVPEEAYHKLSISNQENWISIVRHGDIEAAKRFFSEIGDWQQEKHGDGPLHYSLTNYGNVFEIYPLRKTPSIRTEYIVEKNSQVVNPGNEDNFLDPEGRKIRFMWQDTEKIN